MHFSSLLNLLALVLAFPANASPERQEGPRSFAELSISGGEAGNAENEAQRVFPKPDDLASVSKQDLETLKTERETAETAETDGFNPALEDASGDEATALQNGKIKNKVLKLTGEILALQIEQAQGEDNADKIEEEQKKLNNNIQIDKDAAGQGHRSTGLHPAEGLLRSVLWQ